ncbi:unnamed protein product [Nippostrongylus brasiliensis]|uniref:DUF3969 family protein n=1 Tax=Nippostrongylus brasiliensis TaxID=27835 RepID=A0A0N4YUW0_NIPBR|nr:unnamed protein product [Nippostrongylus brasiliensis]
MQEIAHSPKRILMEILKGQKVIDSHYSSCAELIIFICKLSKEVSNNEKLFQDVVVSSMRKRGIGGTSGIGL